MKDLKPYTLSLYAVHISVTYKTINKYWPELAPVDTPNPIPEKVGINLISNNI